MRLPKDRIFRPDGQPFYSIGKFSELPIEQKHLLAVLTGDRIWNR